MSQKELIARGHAILDEAPRDYSAITNLVVDALAEGWDEGYLWKDPAYHCVDCMDEEDSQKYAKELAEKNNPYRKEEK